MGFYGSILSFLGAGQRCQSCQPMSNSLVNILMKLTIKPRLQIRRLFSDVTNQNPPFGFGRHYNPPTKNFFISHHPSVSLTVVLAKWQQTIKSQDLEPSAFCSTRMSLMFKRRYSSHSITTRSRHVGRCARHGTNNLELSHTR